MDKSFYFSFFTQFWPLVCLILVFAHTIWSVKQIRRAVQDQLPEFEASKISELSAFAPDFNWKWMLYWFLIVVLMFNVGVFGVPIYLPIFLLFSHVVVKGVIQYGKMGYANRGVIGEYVLRVIGTGAMFLIPNFIYPGQTILDGKLAVGIVILGAGLIATYLGLFMDAKYKTYRLLPRSAIGIGIILSGVIGMLLLNTLWRPMTDRKLAQYVEAFDRTSLASSSWSDWATASKWLQDSKVSLELSKPRALLEDVLTDSVRDSRIWWSAFLGGVFKSEDVDRLSGAAVWQDVMNSIFREQYKTSAFNLSKQQDLLAVLLLQDRGEITEAEHVILKDRLAATLTEIADQDFFPVLTELHSFSIVAQRLGYDELLKSAKRLVEKSLVDQQVRWSAGATHYGNQDGPGGFSQSNAFPIIYSDPSTTAQAIDLMQIHGVPSGVDLAALRSYLQPSYLSGVPFIGKMLEGRAMVNYVSRARLESIPGIAPVSWLNYLRAEVHLISSILFLALCVYAIYVSPFAKRLDFSPQPSEAS